MKSVAHETQLSLLRVKRCSLCGLTKDETEFYKDPRSADGLRTYCKPCHHKQSNKNRTPEKSKEYMDRYRARKGDTLRLRHRDTHFERTYGITGAEYDAMVVAQGGVCAICKGPPVGGRGKRLYVDHDHATGVVRGLLCHHCNAAIGNAKDDISLLRAAITYLEHHNAERSNGE